MSGPRFEIEWSAPAGLLRAIEPTHDEVANHASALTAAYNDPLNAPMLGHDAELSRDDVLEHYAKLRDQRAHAFLLFCDGALAGDADLRGIAGGAAEFAFMIAMPSAQGKGLGTAFATMVHAFGFSRLALDAIYASIIPANTASRRAFDKLGYSVDVSPAARQYADPGDVTMSIGRDTFERVHGSKLASIRIREHSGR
ncbi:MAG: GNAT family N-acetyltransferase [Kofleriaceae bacterium]